MFAPRPLIVFNEPGKQFLPGEEITGYVLVENQKPRSARSVIVNWRGTSETRCVSLTTPSFKQNVFSATELLWTAKDGKNKMPAGTHKFPFAYTLPKNCPPTLQSITAANKYKLEVVADIPWMINQKVEREFLVTNKLSNDISTAAISSEWNFRSGIIFNEGPIGVKLSMPTTVLRPGQLAMLQFQLNNHSTRTLRRIDVVLNKKIHVHARPQHAPCNRKTCHQSPSNHRISIHQIGEEKSLKFRIRPNTKETHTLFFEIPENLPTPNFATGLMSFEYFFQFRLIQNLFGFSYCNVNAYIGETEEKFEIVMPAEMIAEVKKELKRLEAMETVRPIGYKL